MSLRSIRATPLFPPTARAQIGTDGECASGRRALRRALIRDVMFTRLQSGFFHRSPLFAAFKKLHWVPRHDGRDGGLVDKLGVPVSPQQHAEIVKPGYHPLQLHAIDEKNCEVDLCFTYMIKEGVL